MIQMKKLVLLLSFLWTLWSPAQSLAEKETIFVGMDSHRSFDLLQRYQNPKFRNAVIAAIKNPDDQKLIRSLLIDINHYSKNHLISVSGPLATFFADDIGIVQISVIHYPSLFLVNGRPVLVPDSKSEKISDIAQELKKALLQTRRTSSLWSKIEENANADETLKLSLLALAAYVQDRAQVPGEPVWFNLTDTSAMDSNAPNSKSSAVKMDELGMSSPMYDTFSRLKGVTVDCAEQGAVIEDPQLKRMGLTLLTSNGLVLFEGRDQALRLENPKVSPDAAVVGCNKSLQKPKEPGTLVLDCESIAKSSGRQFLSIADDWQVRDKMQVCSPKMKDCRKAAEHDFVELYDQFHQIAGKLSNVEHLNNFLTGPCNADGTAKDSNVNESLECHDAASGYGDLQEKVIQPTHRLISGYALLSAVAEISCEQSKKGDAFREAMSKFFGMKISAPAMKPKAQ